MSGLARIIVIGTLLVIAVAIGLPLLAPAPPPRISTPVPANEATRVSVVATTGIPEKPSDVWAIASVGIFQSHVSIEGGTMVIANIPAEAAMKIVLPLGIANVPDIPLGEVVKGVTGDGYVVPGVQLMDESGSFNLEVVDDPSNKKVTIRPKVPIVILHSYINLKSLRWTVTNKQWLGVAEDDTRLIEFIGDSLQTKLDEQACSTVVTDSKGRSGTAVELGRTNIEEFLSGILSQAYDSAERQLQETNPDVHVIRPTVVFEWPDTSCYVIPKQRPENAPGGARP